MTDLSVDLVFFVLALLLSLLAIFLAARAEQHLEDANEMLMDAADHLAQVKTLKALYEALISEGEHIKE